MIETVSADAQELFVRLTEYLSVEEQTRVRTAFTYASEKHSGQMRKSGEPYITHPATVAYYLAEYHLDSDALIAALLHDVAEDTPASIPDIEQQFGKAVAQIVDGVTKLQQSALSVSAKEAHHQTVSKLFRFMTRDVRVVMIKLFDRLHNIRTIGSMPQHKKERIAQETLDIYARLANRLGMWELKNELESRSFQIINPTTYTHIQEQIDDRLATHALLIEQVYTHICQQLATSPVKLSRVCVSPRNAYTIFKKHQYALDAMRVDHVPRLLIVVKDKIACYTTLGLIHALWKPIPGEFDDYVAQPRDNLYRALHTTVRHGNGQLLKFRIRTEAMAMLSEIGVLGRWINKGSDMSPEMAGEMGEQVNALFKSIEQNVSDKDTEAATVVQTVLGDILSDQITIYTPKGEPRELPLGATALDFAFKIHTQVGATAHRATINSKSKPLNTPLRDGDTVVILRRSQSPQRSWLDEDLGFLHTSSARNVVRRSFRKLPQALATKEGHTLLDEELTMLGQQFVAHDIIAEWLGYPDTSTLYYALGRADLLVADVSRRVMAQAWHKGREKNIGRRVTATHTKESYSAENETFIILGASDVDDPLQLCKKCLPRPRNPIRGLLDKNQSVIIHQLICPLLPSDTESDKLLQLHWGEESTGSVKESFVELEVYDRPNLLYEVTDILRAERINIPWINTPRGDNTMRIELCLDINSPRQLISLLHRIKVLTNVRSIRYCPTKTIAASTINTSK